MKITIALVTTVLSLGTLNANATAPAAADAVQVRYSDLDLSRKAGIATLYQRIQGAAQRVCETHTGRRLEQQRGHAACVDNAVARAVARIDRPMLSDYAARQMGKQADVLERVVTR
jgi:UrcA family protein